MDLVGVDVQEIQDLNTLQVGPKVLGEGAFGCVLKSADGKYAIKVQEVSAKEKCEYESSLQRRLSESVLNAAVANVYFYDANVTSIPYQWRDTLSSSCKKAPMWMRQNWTGRFCITVMDFLPGEMPGRLHPYNFPIFCFALLYTVSQGYEKIRFQHLDIKTGNIIMTPTKSTITEETYYLCSMATTFKFTHMTMIPKLVDFGLSTTVDIPSSIDVIGNKGATLMITPFEVVVGRIGSSNPSIKTFMHTDGPKRYHWSYDLFSIGITILNATLAKSEQDIIGFRMIQDVIPYMNGLLQKYGINDKSEEAVHPGMVMMYMYNLCILQELFGNGRYPTDSKNIATFYPPGTVGYDLLFTPDNRRVIDYIVTKNTSLYAGDLAIFKQSYGKSAFDLVASLLRWNPDERGGGYGYVLYNPYFNSFASRLDCPTTPSGPPPQGPKVTPPPPQGPGPSKVILVVGTFGGKRVAFLNWNAQTKQATLFQQCRDIEGCTPEELNKRPNYIHTSGSEKKTVFFFDMQTKKMTKTNQYYIIMLDTLVQLALASASGASVTNGPVIISSEVLSAVRNFKKQRIL